MNIIFTADCTAHLSVSPVHCTGEALRALAGHHVDKLLEGDG